MKTAAAFPQLHLIAEVGWFVGLAAPVTQAVGGIAKTTPHAGNNYSSMTDPDVE